MQVILTHEQADFDALAAVLGASLVHPGAIAVLPRRMNSAALPASVRMPPSGWVSSWVMSSCSLPRPRR